MRRIVPFIFFAAPVLADTARVTTVFNRDFRFAFGSNPGAAAPGFDDASWSRTILPHSFSIPYFRSPRFPVGEGWYRKHFTVGETRGRRYRLEFEAAFQVCDVYVNGRRAGGHEGGYTGFAVDLTPYLKTGDNVIAVRVDNFWRGDLPPRAGEHVFSGGLYRDVRLVETGPANIAFNGIRVTTPEVSEARATVLVNVATDAPAGASASVEILDASGTVVGKGVPGTPVVLDKPRLWSPDTPALYTARVTLANGGAIDDIATVRFGVRSFRFDKDKGFFLNGKHLWLRGVNRHQDQAGWGDAVADTAHYRDAKMLKDAGFNFVRGSHYPHDPAFLDACDELGLLVWSENTFWGIGGFSKKDNGTWSCSAYPNDPKYKAGFETNDRRLLAEMIAERINHPSIVVWSMSNEPFFTDKSVMVEAKAHMRDLIDDTHRLDPTRPAGIGGAQREGFDKIGDVTGYNGDGARFPNPGRPSLVAEYGSRIEDRPGTFAPFFTDGTDKPLEWRSGVAIWCGFHHGSIAGSMGRMGIIDYFRLPLRQYWWYRENYAGVPHPAWPVTGRPVAMKLTADRTALTSDGTSDAQVVVTLVDAAGNTVSSAPDVTLDIVSGPGELPTGPSITFRHGTDIDIRDGMAAIAFRSTHAGRTILRARSAGLPDATITFTTTGDDPWRPEYAADWRKPRPYEPGAVRVMKRTVIDNIGASRPTRASSSRDDAHSPDKANDGDAATAWIAAPSTDPAVWRLDLENFYKTDTVTVTFADSAIRDVTLRISDDGEHWTDIAVATGAKGVVTLRPAAGAHGRFVRLDFRGEPPAVSEIVVSGVAD